MDKSHPWISPQADGKVFEPTEAPPRPEPRQDSALQPNLNETLEQLKAAFHAPLNSDLVIRRIDAGDAAAALVFVDGMTDRTTISRFLLQPISECASLLGCGVGKHLSVLEDHIAAVSLQTVKSFNPMVAHLLDGQTAILVDGCAGCLVAETRGYEKRAVSNTVSESVAVGPQEGFTENLRTNITLLRRQVRSENLVCEMIPLGNPRTFCALLYRCDIANPSIVQEARRRLGTVQTRNIQSTGAIMQLIEDHPHSVFPQIVMTERPDRIASFLMEGQAAILCDGSPLGLGFPATFYHLFHSPDDTFMRWPYGSMLRLIRAIGLFAGIFLPGLHIALVNYHPALIPTELLHSITETHSGVPFSMALEVILMVLIFDIIGEAGTRVPGVMGAAISIVGALILGQAAVAANIISPIVIITVAITGLGGFCVPNYGFSLGVRLLRLIFAFAGALCGLYGMVLAFFAFATMMCSMRSFGVPFFSPVSPSSAGNPDLLLRYPLWMQNHLPAFLNPKTRRRRKS